MSEFDKYWNESSLSIDKEVARSIWNSAQKAAVKTILHPQLIPKVGDVITQLSLIHSNWGKSPKKVIDVNKELIEIYFIQTSTLDGELSSSGILGEVELND